VHQISEYLFYSFGVIFDSIHQDIVRSRMAIEVSTGWQGSVLAGCAVLE
jgi:hypothetical protein